MDSSSGGSVQLGSVKLTGRSHAFEALSDPPLAKFGDAMELVSGQLEPAQVRSAEKLTVKLRWRAAAELQHAYKVFAHVVDPIAQQVVAQRDAEPQDGGAPTTGWVGGEVIDDEYTTTLPAGLAAGEYPVEVGVYDPRTGERLRLADGDNRLILATKLQVH